MIWALGFPLTYYIVIFGFLVGACVSAVLVGTFSVAILWIFVVLGILRILPLLELLGRVFEAVFPGVKETIQENLKESFPIHGEPDKDPNKGAIYMWHPHGVFSMAHFFHIGTRFTDWPVRPIHGTAIHWFWWVPFGKELLEAAGFVPSHYKSMKKVLEDGNSLSVTLGGVREITFCESGIMRLNIAKRKGIFRMAIETGKPLVPVLVYGENELYDLVKHPWLDTINNFLVQFALFIPLPSMKGSWNWLQLAHKPLETKVESFLGDPVQVGPARHATEEDIVAIREKYFQALRELYAKTRPAHYKADLEIA
jgi:hypothetical protein